jgi:hypothetical protein
MRHRGRKNSGFALMLVLILVATAVILSSSYMSVASIRTHVADNYRAMARARYLAESGVQHAMYLLRADPSSLSTSQGPFYLDDNKDTYTIAATPVAGSPGRYQVVVTATAASCGTNIPTAPASARQIIQKTSARLVRRLAPTVGLRHAMMIGGGTVRPSSRVTINGDIHINGYMDNYGYVNGCVTTTGGLNDPFGRISGPKDGSAAAKAMPAISTAQFSAGYAMDGQNYTSVTCDKKDINNTNDLQDEATHVPASVCATNVGGIVRLDPDWGETPTIGDNVTYTGTLVVTGDLLLKGKNIHLTAVNGFPAIICTGRLLIQDNATIVIDGLVVAQQGVAAYNNNSSNSTLLINGGLVTNTTGIPFMGGTQSINYSQDLADVYNFSLPADKRTPTIAIEAWTD